MSTREGEDERRIPGAPWMSTDSAKAFIGWARRERVEAFVVIGIDNQRFVFVPAEGGFNVYTHGRCYDVTHAQLAAEIARIRSAA